MASLRARILKLLNSAALTTIDAAGFSAVCSEDLEEAMRVMREDIIWNDGMPRPVRSEAIRSLVLLGVSPESVRTAIECLAGPEQWMRDAAMAELSFEALVLAYRDSSGVMAEYRRNVTNIVLESLAADSSAVRLAAVKAGGLLTLFDSEEVEAAIRQASLSPVAETSLWGHIALGLLGREEAGPALRAADAPLLHSEAEEQLVRLALETIDQFKDAGDGGTTPLE